VLELSAGRRGAAVEVVTELDADLAPQPPVRAVLRAPQARQPARAEISIPSCRGAARARAARGARAVDRPARLIEHRIAASIGQRVGVVPNLGLVRAMALRMFSDHSFMTGLKIEKFLGDGSEFEALREYVPGLDHRAIDWKSSARHRKLLCTEFRASATTRSCSRSTPGS